MDADPASTYMGETREERLRQFHEEPSPSWDYVKGRCFGSKETRPCCRARPAARTFLRGKEPIEVQPGTALEELLAS